ncbi:MAG: glycosyltransferase [Acidobacteriota bacterium]|nr:glycosyltransferase [Acidobacteriota bacterium]
MSIALLVSLGLPAFAAGRAPAAPAPHAGMAKQFAFREAMRKLWEDHVVWTRQFVVSAVADLPDKAAAAERLLQNQADIGNAVKPFYGDAAGERLSALLKEHITVAAELVSAVKANDKAKADDAGRRWDANADEIATFLSGANPKAWPAAEMRKMMREHLELTTAEVAARLRGDWAADIAAYEKIHTQILHMADMLSAGIISQFPQKFE